MKNRNLTFAGICILVLSFFAVAVNLFADDVIKHKFLLLDESRKQILFVDQFDSKNDWVIKLTDGGVWDLQLIGDHRLLVALTDKGGFREYDLRTREVVREVSDAKYKQTMTAIRFPDGKTLLGCNKSKAYQFYLLDADGKLISEVPAESKKKTIRVARRTSRGTILFGCNDEWVNEIDLTGKVLREFKVPGARHIYHVAEKADGNLLVAAGYGCFVAEYDKDNKEVRKLGVPVPDGLKFIFFSKMNPLKNGNLVVATWTGHGANDSNKGVQLVEFNSKGDVVWTWHNPKLAGSINNVIVLDDLDTSKFYE
ncbi:MAG: aryl-sulfate sulfotransferase [Planctomycetaceae bacterium]|jgi:WD40 repeat protein|nr:aryl-sulfate sulfotransferase [Planctomycetaceae bacterium]